ncbi:MAG TPA: LacI family DNA-binding transcriptional regulator [Anaerovoracaceae bacterium]|nr:LacI family DNA-binding transcriptional regulator [Anaerovoracaceae bacterium]
MITLKDVAQLAGYSVSTVSRALNGSSRIDNETRTVILEAAKKLNYQANLNAKSLRTKSTRLIGIISEGSTNYMFSQYIQYISDYCTSLGYGLLVANHNNDPMIEERLFNNYYQRGIDGMILSLVSEESRIFRSILDSTIPIVLVDRYLVFEHHFHDTCHASIVLNNMGAGRMAADCLMDLGHRYLACITGPMSVGLSRERTNGFVSRIYERGGHIDNKHLVEGNFSFESGYAAAMQILGYSERLPTAIWAENDMMAIGVIKALAERSISVPDDISVIGMDDVGFSRMITPPLTTISQPYKDMATTAVDVIASGGTGGGGKQKRFVFDGALVMRDSVTECRDK